MPAPHKSFGSASIYPECFMPVKPLALVLSAKNSNYATFGHCASCGTGHGLPAKLATPYGHQLIQQLTKVSYRTFLSVFSEIFVVTFLKKNICSDIEVQVKNNGKVPDLMLNTSDMRIFGDVKALIQDPATFPEGPVLNYSSSVMSHK